MASMLENKKSKSILKYILIPVCILLILEVVVFSGVVIVGGVMQHLESNARDILSERVINRKSFLENEMVNNWSNIETLAETINQKAMSLQQEGQINMTELDQSSDTALPLLKEIDEDMINTLRNQHVSGIFVVFNNHDLDEKVENKPGLYIRDLDPTSNASINNTDLLIERGSKEMVKQLSISTDISWNPQFVFTEKYYSFLYEPYQTALKYQSDYSISDLGYWSSAFTLSNDEREIITYSIPLIDANKQVYGVLGVEVSHDYLSSLLPQEEINEKGNGSYSLAIYNQKANDYLNVYSKGNIVLNESIDISKQQDEQYYLKNSERKVYASIEKLKLYNSNTPYIEDEWVLIAFVPNDDLLAFSHDVNFVFFAAMVMTLLFGIIGSIFISLRLSHPIKQLSETLENVNDSTIPKLDKTNISEIDHLVTSLEQMNKNMLETARRFNKIIELASVKLAAFEMNAEKDEFYLTENFFSVFKQDKVDQRNMNISSFKDEMKKLKAYLTRSAANKYLYAIPYKEDFVFIELTISYLDDSHTIGLAEDITQRVLEQKIIEYERDHDALTGLLNRRAFWNEMNELFQNKRSSLKKAAFLMIDLDNLKYINDHYGHDSGDTYILKATNAFVKYTPERTLISRISGDEFNLFFYGYDSEEEIRVLINQLKIGIDRTYMMLSPRNRFYIKVSGGISWYPKDTTSVEKLQLYSDYAMYKVKHSKKGEFRNFSLENYRIDNYLNRNKEEFEVMIKNRLLQYHYQPIVDSKTGNIFAYEALMRSSMPTLKNVEEVLELAKREGKLEQIETITFFKALEGYRENIKAKNICENCKLFVNSIASHCMSKENVADLEKEFAPYLKNLVIEVTEGEKVNEAIHQRKQQWVEKWGGELALDDYGSGYNSEKMLLDIIPKYIKVDMDIIRGIDIDGDKQKIVENIVSYAHERKMYVIAEGIETMEELKQVIKLDVDYLQGFLLAKPQNIPAKIAKNLVQLIQSLQS
ncbi:MAG: sensor domain-containing phosphodiesterase [Erysipelotrichia bacterium]|nr:sensor domain-containing phosphodiesterase [Erysipelotrichia bacterium]NCC53987.1 sensor domain-containing phosphodiesterase [Erysipelotrichia bacterium]